jgi:hypothetical protein
MIAHYLTFAIYEKKFEWNLMCRVQNGIVLVCQTNGV